MKIFKPFLSVIFILAIYLRVYGQEKKALQLMDKNKFDELIAYLNKEIIKDSLNPGAYYIKSLLFSESLFPRNNIDSAYRLIKTAENQYKAAGEKKISGLQKAGITPVDLDFQKSKIETLAFEKAKAENTVDGYNDFLLNYDSTSDYTKAVELRNKNAFETAAHLNTYEAYLDFVKTYPDARQTPEAQNRYDLLIYREFTKDGQLQSFEKFAHTFPASAHWEEAVLNVFRLSTTRNNTASYIDIFKTYPQARISRVAAGYLYLTAQDTSWFQKTPSEDYPFMDSLKTLIRLDTLSVFPVYENNLYGLMDQSGQMIIASKYKNIDPPSFCGIGSAGYLVVSDDSSRFLVARNGCVIWNKPFYNVENLGLGLLKLSQGSKYGVIHESGFNVLPFEYTDVGLVGNHFIKAQKNQEWELYSFTGIKMTDQQFDGIDEDGNFIILQKSGKIAVTTADRILDNHPFQADYRYDDAALIDKDHILCSSGNNECIVNKDLQFTIPLETQHIFSNREGWLVKRDSLCDIYDAQFKKISGSGLKDISYKGDWMTGRVKSKWILYYKYSLVPGEFLLDSVSILNDDYVWTRNEGKEQILCRDFATIGLDIYTGFKMMPRAQISADAHFPVYMELKKKNQEMSILNPSGRICFSGKFDNLQSIGYQYFLFSKNNKFGLIDTTGKTVLNPVYEGISDYHNGFVTTLKDKKFGIANPEKGIEVQPRFSASPEPFGNNYFRFREDNHIGMIGEKGLITLDTIGTDIRPWNDTTFLLRSGDAWCIHSFRTHQVWYPGILSYNPIYSKGGETFYRVEKDNAFGVISNRNGPLIHITFTDVLNIGNPGNPVYFAEKYIPEADLYIVIYYSGQGNMIRKQVYSPKDYSKIYCR